MVSASTGLSRRGRPPHVKKLGEGKFSVKVRGVALTFATTGKGLRRVDRNETKYPEDVTYAKEVIGRGVGVSA